MATLAQKTADAATLIDDIAATITTPTDANGNQYWVDADADVVNDGTTGDWHNNGRVFEHTPTGNHLLFFLHDSGNIPAGIRCLMSEGWNATDTRPSGRSNYRTADPVDTTDITGAGGSFSNSTNFHKHTRLGAWFVEGNQRGVSRTTSATYFLSATQDHLAIASWNTSDGTNGNASWMLWEHSDNKFWNDGNGNFYLSGRINYHTGNVYGYNGYGWSTYDSAQDDNTTNIIGGSGFWGASWGHVNPDSVDDTYFFRRPVLFQTNSQTVPAGYVEDLIVNDKNDGLAHGDQITANGTTYQAMYESGAAPSKNLTMNLRFE